MNRPKDEQDQSPSRLLEASGLKDRLLHIRKRRMAFSGQAMTLEAIRQRIEASQRQ